MDGGCVVLFLHLLLFCKGLQMMSSFLDNLGDDFRTQPQVTSHGEAQLQQPPHLSTLLRHREGLRSGT